MYKQVILVRQDLKLSKGKLSAQAAHASLEAAFRSNRKIVDLWRREGGKKVVLKVSDEKALLKYKAEAEKNNLKCALVTDAGRTAVKPGTVTCLGIGPDTEKRIDRVTGRLRMA
jgi:PTH2 family peptidyl-tRNA hydrolase